MGTQTEKYSLLNSPVNLNSKLPSIQIKLSQTPLNSLNPHKFFKTSLKNLIFNLVMSGLVQYPAFEKNAPVLWTVSNGETSITKNCVFLESGEKFQDQALVEYEREGKDIKVWVAKKNLKADMTSSASSNISV